jgi:GxxExxY protein
MSENEISKIVVDASFRIHKETRPGLFESVYEEILFYELIKSNLSITRQQEVPVFWDGKKLELGFRTDLLVDNKLIIEIKSIEELGPVHHKQLLTYLELTGIKLGLLINFNEALIKDGIKRIANNL